MNGITLKEVLEKLQEAVEVEDWTIVQELLNTIEENRYFSIHIVGTKPEALDRLQGVV